MISIYIDPTINVNNDYDRYDLLLRGLVFSDRQINEVVVLLDGIILGRIKYGQFDHAAHVIQLDGKDTRFQYPFHYHLPLKRVQGRDAVHLDIGAHTSDGQFYEEAFELSLDSSKPLGLISGPRHTSLSNAAAPSSLLFCVERAAVKGDRNLFIRGWVVSLTPINNIRVFVDDNYIGAADLGGERDDVAVALPTYPNASTSGFSLNIHLSSSLDKAAAIRLEAASSGGTCHEVTLQVNDLLNLGEKDFPKPSERFKLQIDTPRLVDRRTVEPISNHLTITGWALARSGISAIDVWLDGEHVGSAHYGMTRQDVFAAFADWPEALHSGFAFHCPPSFLRNGWQEVQLEVKANDGEVLSHSFGTRVNKPHEDGAFHGARAHDQSEEFHFHIDTPRVVNGLTIAPISNHLTITGWALARSGVSGIDVWLDGQLLGSAHYGLTRQDVCAAFPDWTESAHSGYAFHCPPRLLRNGLHEAQLHVKANDGEVLRNRFTIHVKKSHEDEAFTIRRRLIQQEIDVGLSVLAELKHHPGFALIVRLESDFEAAALMLTVLSLQNQIYQNWFIHIITVDAATTIICRSLIADIAPDLARRIQVFERMSKSDFSAVRGGAGLIADFFGFLSVGDELGCNALLEVAISSGLHPAADLIYADEIRVSPSSHEREPFLKPDYSPDLLLSTNYIGRPWFVSAALIARAKITPNRLIAAGEYDAVLRCTELANQIHHVPKLLCWRSGLQIDEAAAEAVALKHAAKRRGFNAEVSLGCLPGTWRLRRIVPQSKLVSIVIPTCAAQGHIKKCISSLRERTDYRNMEIICVENIPAAQAEWKLWLQQAADKVVNATETFNWSHFNNLGAKVASGEFLLFLNDDIEVIQPDWLDAMLEHAHQPDVAIVGPQLLYPDRTVQHAGMFLATPSRARHAFRYAAENEPGYFGLALTQRNVIAVTGACMLMRRSIYRELGGFNAAHQVINNDLDFCLRAHQKGMLTVFTPYAKLIHYEGVSRERLTEAYDFVDFGQRWKTLFFSGDPYFNPRLSRHSDDYRPDDEPTQTVFVGHPLFRHSDIKRILVMKIDHIGDFVTAIPAIRRLKQIFPAAEIHVLASRVVRALVTLDFVESFIEFDFFHPVSGLGPRQIAISEYEGLRERLAAYNFDIAVDLRKQLDTREVMRYTPARYLVGYDHMGQFPFLDIALEWEGDKPLQRKRTHVTDDLMNLVEAIGTAANAETGRLTLDINVPRKDPPSFLNEKARALFSKPVVAIHPGVGDVMRQWPPHHFAALVDLLVEKNAVNIVLIGGPEETGLATQVLSHIINQDSVCSLVGKTSLSNLPQLLSACALYVGNNSGPKHIAAMLGVPTIGIHSGVVDAAEWGPIGPRAVAVQRNMACSPCYLARMEDCPRGFACMNELEPGLVHEVAEVFLARPVVPSVQKPAESAVKASGKSRMAKQRQGLSGDASAPNKRQPLP